MTLRTQYHFRKVGDDVWIWNVRRLLDLVADQPRFQVALAELSELDQDYWYLHETPTCRSVAHHAQLIATADLGYPILLDRSNRVMDGMHRVCKALNLGHASVLAVRLPIDPAPDYLNRAPSELPYDELS